MPGFQPVRKGFNKKTLSKFGQKKVLVKSRKHDTKWTKEQLEQYLALDKLARNGK